MERDDWVLLKRYHRGDCTPDEAARVPAEWITPQGRAALAVLIRAAEHIPEASPSPDRVAAYRRFEQALGSRAEPLSERPGVGRQPARPAWHRWIGVTGLMVAMVCGIGVWAFGSHRTSSTGALRTYQTATGQRSTVRLDDGSTMMLAPATTVVMTGEGMTVTGEAYFTVEPRAARPFVVRTNNASVRVLGTRFSVRQYPDEARSRVIVEDGRVALHTLHAQRAVSTPTVVSSRMLAVVSDSGVTVTNGIAVSEYTSWTRGVLVFNGVSLGDAVKELSRVYGNEIRVADPELAKHTMRMEVPVSTHPLARVLEVICEVNDAHVTRDGQSYILVPGRRAVRPPAVVPSRSQFPQSEQQYGR